MPLLTRNLPTLKVIDRMHTRNLRDYKRLWTKVWKNPDKLTPQQYCDTLGTDAAQFFAFGATLATLMTSVKPGVTVPGTPAGYTVTPNSDGTVTITPPPAVAAPAAKA